MVAQLEENQAVAVNFKGGGSFIELPPIFSADGESVFVSWRNSILEYNTKTGKLVHEYKTSHQLIGFSYHIYDIYNCIAACSENGKVTFWKTTTHYKILEKVLPVSGINTFNIIYSADLANTELKALVSYTKKNRVKFGIANLNKKVHTDVHLTLGRKEKYYLSTSEKYFSVVCENIVYFLKFDEPKTLFKCTINPSRHFTCVASHPNEEIVLTGDSSGRVIAWQNIFATQKTQNVFHWHTLPVRTVCFSTSGSYFYSGGSECVLVKWQLENANDRKFVPRLSSDIHHVSVANNNVLVAVATEDNGIKIFDNMLNHTTLIQHFVLGKHYECGIIYDPRTRSLIMNGSQGHVQFYSPEHMSLLYNVDIIGQNKITNERECKMINTEITKLALSKSGKWLASIEERRDLQYNSEIRLKFWHFSETNQIFELNSSIEYPHDKSVSSIMFQPALKDDNLHCVTVGDDKKFKIWQLENITTVYKKDMVWKCYGVGFFRNLPCCALSFCVDGSLMATGFGSILTTWVPDTCELKCTLVHPIHKEVVRHIQFGYGDQCHLLISASTNQLCIWNLLTLSMMWTVPVSVRLLIADTFSTSMAVFTEDRKVFIFSPGSSALIYKQQLNTKKVIAATFVPTRRHNDTRLKWYERSNIYFISSNHELYALGASENIPETLEQFEDISDFIPPTTRVDATEPMKPVTHLYKRDEKNEALKKYLASPIHTMVPITLACQSLLRSFIVQKHM